MEIVMPIFIREPERDVAVWGRQADIQVNKYSQEFDFKEEIVTARGY